MGALERILGLLVPGGAARQVKEQNPAAQIGGAGKMNPNNTKLGAARAQLQPKQPLPYKLPGGGTSQFNPNSVTNAGNLNPRTEDGYDVDVSHFNPGGEDGYDTTIAHLNGNMQNAPLPAFTLNRLGYGGTMNPGQQPRNGGYLGGGVPTFNGRIYEDAYAQKLYGPSGWINRY